VCQPRRPQSEYLPVGNKIKYGGIVFPSRVVKLYSYLRIRKRFVTSLQSQQFRLPRRSPTGHTRHSSGFLHFRICLTWWAGSQPVDAVNRNLMVCTAGNCPEASCKVCSILRLNGGVCCKAADGDSRIPKYVICSSLRSSGMSGCDVLVDWY
jgi:hypothetical protein